MTERDVLIAAVDAATVAVWSDNASGSGRTTHVPDRAPLYLTADWPDRILAGLDRAGYRIARKRSRRAP